MLGTVFPIRFVAVLSGVRRIHQAMGATPGTKGHLFEAQSQAYAAFRPTYSDSLFDTIYKFSGSPRKELAVDVGCGTGQVAARLARDYARVIGCDGSASQLSVATPAPNLSYTQSPAERMEFLADSSVDLVTVGEALHWFDTAAFYREVRRVLRSDGTMALFGYDFHFFVPGSRDGAPSAADIARANAINDGLCLGTLGPYWDDGRLRVRDRYRGLEPGADDFRSVTRVEDLTMHRTCSVNNLVGMGRVAGRGCGGTGAAVGAEGQSSSSAPVLRCRKSWHGAARNHVCDSELSGGHDGGLTCSCYPCSRTCRLVS